MTPSVLWLFLLISPFGEFVLYPPFVLVFLTSIVNIFITFKKVFSLHLVRDERENPNWEIETKEYMYLYGREKRECISLSCCFL